MASRHATIGLSLIKQKDLQQEHSQFQTKPCDQRYCCIYQVNNSWLYRYLPQRP